MDTSLSAKHPEKLKNSLGAILITTLYAHTVIISKYVITMLDTPVNGDYIYILSLRLFSVVTSIIIIIITSNCPLHIKSTHCWPPMSSQLQLPSQDLVIVAS